MRSLNELYRIAYGRIMDASDGDFEGLCHLIKTLRYDKLISDDEYIKLKSHLKKNRPSEWKHIEFLECIEYDDEALYWWPQGRLEQRKLFLLKMIEVSQPWYIKIVMAWKILRSIERI